MRDPLLIFTIISTLVICSGAQANWIKYGDSPILDVGTSGTWEDASIFSPTILHDANGYRMWYTGFGTNYRIGYATSADGIAWTKYSTNPVFDLGMNGTWDDYEVGGPTVLFDGTTYRMWYNGSDGSHARIGYATSVDGITWDKYDPDGDGVYDPVLNLGSAGAWDNYHVANPTVLFDGAVYKMWYAGHDGSGWRIGYATSTDGAVWMRHSVNPVFDIASSGAWDDRNVDVPSVVYNGSGYEMWYAGLGGNTWRIGHVTSTDGISWTRDTGNPVIDIGPDSTWDDRHVSYPYVMLEGSEYKMWYEGNDGKHSRIGYATAPIPEPSTIILLATGLAGMVAYGRVKIGRKRRA